MNKGVAAILAAILVSGCAHFKPCPPVKGCNFGLLTKISASECLPYGQVEKTVFSLDKLVPKNMLFDEDGIGMSVYKLDAARYVQFEYVDKNFHDYREPRCLLSIFIYDFNSGREYSWNTRERAWDEFPLSASRDQLDEMMGDMQSHD